MVAEVTKEKNIYASAFDAHSARLAQDERESSWVKHLRTDAIESFERQGFPTTTEEEWKYTNLVAIARTRFETAFDDERSRASIKQSDIEPFVYDEARASRMVFINGIFHQELSALEALPEGVVAMNLADALRNGEYENLARETLARSASYDEHALTALNTAFLSEGAFILIPKGVRVEAPVHLLFLSDPDRSPRVSFPRVLVRAERGSEATLIESYSALGDGRYWTNAVVEIKLEDGARLEHYKVQRESLEAFHTATTSVELGSASSFNTTTISLGAEIARHDINVSLNARGAECWVDGLYVTTTGQHTDTHSLIDHRQPHCTSRQLYKGILDGKSRAVFNGKVFVREGALQTDAQQTNRNLLLSGEARVDTKPQLEIFADDVKCAHGATVGQLEEEELFYLISRGLRPELAQNLLTYGFAEEVINKIRVGSIKDAVGRGRPQPPARKAVKASDE